MSNAPDYRHVSEMDAKMGVPQLPPLGQNMQRMDGDRIYMPDAPVGGEVGELLEIRKTTHGNYTDNAEISQQIKRLFREWGYLNLAADQSETLDMIAHKIGRILAGDPNFKDHWVDIAGYAKLSADRCQDGAGG